MHICLFRFLELIFVTIQILQMWLQYSECSTVKPFLRFYETQSNEQ